MEKPTTSVHTIKCTISHRILRECKSSLTGILRSLFISFTLIIFIIEITHITSSYKISYSIISYTRKWLRTIPRVGAARWTLKVGQSGVAWSGQEVWSGFALTVCALPWWLTLCPCGSGFALAARALPSWLLVCPCGLRFTLAAHALPSRLTFCPYGLCFALEDCALPLRLALCPCGLRYVLAACATR